MLIWTTKTGPLCQHFGVLFVESTRLGCVGSITSQGHGLVVLATIRRACIFGLSHVNNYHVRTTFSDSRPSCIVF